MANPILTEQHGEILKITLNRPEAHNALNLDIMMMPSNILARAATDESIKGVMLTGKGKAFCSGGDLKWLSQQAGDAATLHHLAPQFRITITEIRRMGKPVVATINGIAAGEGFSLAATCGFRVMAESTLLRQAFTSSGLSIDGEGTFALTRPVGLARAMEIVAFDQPISSAQALGWGLVTKWFLMINAGDPTGIGAPGISDCANHPNGQEGLKAFVEKRKPVFLFRYAH